MQQKGLLLKKGTIADSTIIAAPATAKNQEKRRDPGAHQVKKGNKWQFGYETHIGVDKDSGYLGAEKREDAITKNNSGKRIRYKLNRRPSQKKEIQQVAGSA